MSLSCTTDAQGDSVCTFPDSTEVSCSEDEGGTVTCSIEPDANLLTTFETVLGSDLLPSAEMARVLSDICPSRRSDSDLQGDCDTLIGLINSSAAEDNAIALRILEQISPTFASVSFDLAIGGANAQDQNVQSRLQKLRGKNGGTDDAVMVSNLAGLLAVNHFAAGSSSTHDLPPATGGAAGEDSNMADSYSKVGGFVNATILSAEKDPTDFELGSDTDTVAFTAGVDYQLSTDYVLGLALGFTSSEAEINSNNGLFEVEGYTMTFYGSYYPTDSIYIDYTISYAGNDYDQSRDIVYTGVNQTASATYTGSLTTYSIGSGYLWQRNALSVDGFAQLIGLTAKVNSYEEIMSNQGAAGAGWALALDGQELTSLTLHLGGQVNYVFDQSWGIVTPLARIEFVSELDDDPRLVTGRFVGDIGDRVAFSVETDEVDSSYANVGVGVSAILTGGKSFYAYYQSTVGYEDVTQSQFNLGGRMEF